MITIYGASDDLVEIDGDVYEEFPVGGDDTSYVGTSNGALIKITYTSTGTWRITPVAGLELISIVQAPEDDEKNYTDRATISGDIAWVVCGTEYAARRSAAVSS